MDEILPTDGPGDLDVATAASTAEVLTNANRTTAPPCALNETICYYMDNAGLYYFLNITNELPINFAVPIYGYLVPFFLVVTIVANTLIVVVLAKKHMRTPTNVVLMAMALSDLFTILFPAPWLLYLYTFGNHYKPLSSVVACYLWKFMNETLPAMFHTASIWLTLALAVQRYIYVCHAPVARAWCTMPRVTKGIAGIFIMAALHQSTRFFDVVYTESTVPWSEHPDLVLCKTRTAKWVTDIVTMDVYFTFYFSFRVIFVHSIPCISLVVLNVLLYRAMRDAQRRRRELFKANRQNESRRLRDTNCTTLMLIVVVTVFLAVEFPLAVVTVLHIISSSVTEILDYDIANALVLFMNFFIILSYPINFGIYCGMSRQFRETFKEIFMRRAPPPPRRGIGSRYSTANSPRANFTNETVL